MRTRRAQGSRRLRELRRRRRRRLCIAAAVALLCLAAMAPMLRTRLTAWLRRGLEAVSAFAPRQASAAVTLPERAVYALQLGVYDSGERAGGEMQRLTAQGIPCIIWQRERMRIICDASFMREGLSAQAAQGLEAYTVQETLEQVELSVSADASAMEDVRTLLLLPDELLAALEAEEEPLRALLERTGEQAKAALTAHPEHLLYTQLAQSLLNWSVLIGDTLETRGEAIARCYARAMICTLCGELRRALQSDASTASAQRTPSTAA